jgi:hypothetical protein
MLKEIAYTGADGKTVQAAYVTCNTAYQLTAKREKFAQLCAQGVEPREAFCQAFDAVLSPDTVEEIKARVSRLLNDTTVVLRIQELKRPVIRKLRRKIEYNLQTALEQCQTAYDLAFEQADSKGMLAAIRMQAELAKLLSQEINVNHRHGLLDDASTKVLLEMKKEIEVRQARQKEKLKVVVGKVETISADPQAPDFGVPNGSHPEAVPN